LVTLVHGVEDRLRSLFDGEVNPLLPEAVLVIRDHGVVITLRLSKQLLLGVEEGRTPLHHELLGRLGRHEGLEHLLLRADQTRGLLEFLDI